MPCLNLPDPMKSLILLALPILVVGCASVGPNYVGAPHVSHRDQFVGGERPDAPQQAAAELSRWWTMLGDRQLNRYVETALSQNFDLRMAQERLLQSRAARRQVAAAFLPQVTAGGGYTRTGLSENTGDLDGQVAQAGAISSTIDQWDVGADVSWEVDVFGGGRRQTEAAQAEVGAAQEAMHAARMATIAEVVDAYFTITGFQEQIATVDENIRLQADTLALVDKRAGAGLSSQLDVQRARAQLESTRASKPTLEAGLTMQLRRLTLLLGQDPSALDGRRGQWASFPSKLPIIQTGLPGDLVMRRPDLRLAERQLAAATAEIGVATANFYPRFYLLGSPQMVSASTTNLFDATSFAGQFAPRVEWSVFSSGRNRALLDAANARQRETLLAFEKAVLGAIGEVESQLATLDAEHRRFAAFDQAVQASEEAVKLAQQLNAAGRTNLLDLLVEEQRLNVLTTDRVRSQTALVLAWVRLHQALGGGWES